VRKSYSPPERRSWPYFNDWATGFSTTAGTQSQIWDCTGNANQQWHLP
jgi:hypothetical protein